MLGKAALIGWREIPEGNGAFRANGQLCIVGEFSSHCHNFLVEIIVFTVS